MITAVKIKTIQPLNDHVIVSDMNFGERRTSGGLFLLNDDARSAGIRPRWARVYAVGPDQQDVQVGQWILVAHGRWTRGVKIEDDLGEHVIRRVDHADIMLVTNEEPADDTQSSAVAVESRERW